MTDVYLRSVPSDTNTDDVRLYDPSAVAGDQTLTPSLFTSTTNGFYAATVTPGAVTLTPDLFTNADSFYAPTVTPGTVTLTPALFTSATNEAYSATVSNGGGDQALSQALVFTETNTFFGATSGVQVSVPIILDTNRFVSLIMRRGSGARPRVPRPPTPM